MGYRPKEDKASGLANYLAERPALKDWDRPTAWLLGTQMISSLRQLILSTIHTGFDIRDWMTAEEGGVVLHDGTKARLPLEQDRTAGDDEYWFDFVADTGDAPALVYCLARAMQRTELTVSGTARTLPRGRMLVIGGDSAYPVADETAIRERWQAPFQWAHKANAEDTPASAIPVFAIPGNHDYYDMLDGFGRQFRKQATPDDKTSLKYPEWHPPLRMPGYERKQLASYFALQLPFDWHLWGVDLGAVPEPKDDPDDDKRPIDVRQQEYFCNLPGGTPKKLIVVTALPVAVHHTGAEKLQGPFKQLGIKPAFTANGELEVDRVRLDLSGDVHLYERYWGAPPDDTATPETIDGDHWPGAVPRENYAAVTSGLGGAFHHPNQVRYCHEESQRRPPWRSWPRERDSKKQLGDVLTRPRKVFQAGSVGVLGAFLGLLFYVLSTTDWGDGPGVLVLPYQLQAGQNHDAWKTFLGFGAVLLFIVAIGLWVFGAIKIRGWTNAIRDGMFEPPDQKKWTGRLRARLDRCLSSGYVAGFLRWTGANRRVMISTIFRLVPWMLFLGSIALLVVLGHYLLRGRIDNGINFAAAILVGAMIGFPFITNGRLKQRWFPFILLGLVHGLAQLYAPQLWAHATIRLSFPMFLLAGYWCIRPLAARLFADHGRWLTLMFVALVAIMLATPLLLSQKMLASPDRWPWIAGLAWLLAGAAGAVFAYDWVKRERWHLWRWAVLVAMLPVQVGAVVLMRYVHFDGDAAWWLGLAGAIIGGAIFSCLWLGWYLVACLQWGWHGNDAGSVARVDDYAEFLRIKLTRDRAEVWAIGVDARTPDEKDDRTFAAGAHLVDHFVVKAPTSGGTT